jgi:tetrahydromethanopterin S-methyltransferase subunit D
MIDERALIDNGFRFVSWVLLHASFSGGTVEPNKHWGPCHKRVPAVVIERVEAAILAAFLSHLHAGFVFSASG